VVRPVTTQFGAAPKAVPKVSVQVVAAAVWPVTVPETSVPLTLDPAPLHPAVRLGVEELAKLVWPPVAEAVIVIVPLVAPTKTWEL